VGGAHGIGLATYVTSTITSGLPVGEDGGIVAIEAAHHKFVHAFGVDLHLLTVLVEDSVEFELAVASQHDTGLAMTAHARFLRIGELLGDEGAHPNRHPHSTVWLWLFLHILNNSMSFW